MTSIREALRVLCVAALLIFLTMPGNALANMVEGPFTQRPSGIAKAQTQTAGAVTVNSSSRIARAADGRDYIVNEVKVTLRDEFAQQIQQLAGAGKSE